MKYMFEKIAISIVGLGLSILVAILGMYLVFNSELKFLYHLLYSAAFILQPVMTVVLIRYMFKKPGEKKPADTAYDEYEDLDDEDEDDEGEKPIFGFFGNKKKPAAAPKPADETYHPEETAPYHAPEPQPAAAPAPQPAAAPEPAPFETPETDSSADLQNEIPEAAFGTTEHVPGAALEELEQMERESAAYEVPDFDPADDSGFAGAIGKKFSGLFGSKSGDNL